MWTNFAWIAVLGVFTAGCTKMVSDKTPEGALESYVTSAFTVKRPADREKLLQLSTGEAHEQLQAMSEDNFMARFGKGNLRLISLKMKDRRGEKDGGISLVYELSYEETTQGKGPVTHKKVAYLKEDGGHWRIRGTKNIKEYVEQAEPMVIELTK
jgi:hypothetical protein